MTGYFFKLSRCGGLDMAPALPQAADIRSAAGNKNAAGDWPAAFSFSGATGWFVRPWLPFLQLMGASRRTVGK